MFRSLLCVLERDGRVWNILHVLEVLHVENVKSVGVRRCAGAAQISVSEEKMGHFGRA